MAAFNFDLMGIGDNVLFGKNNPRIRHDGAGKLQVRNSTDVAFANMQGLAAVVADDFVTLAQLQAAQLGLSWKEPARVASTAAVDIAVAPAAIDTIALNAGDRILIKDGSTANPGVLSIDNGIYDYNGGGNPLTRSSDMATGADATNNALFISEGAVNADLAFVETNDPAIVDTDLLQFQQFASVSGGVTSVVSVGTGVSLVNNSGPPTAEIRSLTSVDNSVDITLNAQEVDFAVDPQELLGVVLTRFAAFTFSTASPFNIGAAIGTNSRVLRTRVNVTVPFTIGSGATLEVGDGGNPGALMTTAQNDLENVGLYVRDNLVFYAAGVQLIGTLAPGAAVAGDGEVVVEFFRS